MKLTPFAKLFITVVILVVVGYAFWHYKGHEWPAFNIADAALVVGVGLMGLDMLLAPKPAAVKDR